MKKIKKIDPNQFKIHEKKNQKPKSTGKKYRKRCKNHYGLK